MTNVNATGDFETLASVAARLEKEIDPYQYPNTHPAD